VLPHGMGERKNIEGQGPVALRAGLDVHVDFSCELEANLSHWQRSSAKLGSGSCPFVIDWTLGCLSFFKRLVAVMIITATPAASASMVRVGTQFHEEVFLTTFYKFLCASWLDSTSNGSAHFLSVVVSFFILPWGCKRGVIPQVAHRRSTVH
jgi:hypothetical protein